MPQLQLPMFPAGVTEITPQLAFKREAGKVWYFSHQMPVACHEENDLQTFRMVTSQFFVMGLVTQSDLTRVFGVTPISVKRSVKIFREKGPGGFYAARRARGAAVLVSEVVEKAEELLTEGVKVSDVAKQLSISADTLRKGIDSGRVRVKKKQALKG